MARIGLAIVILLVVIAGYSSCTVAQECHGKGGVIYRDLCLKKDSVL